MRRRVPSRGRARVESKRCQQMAVPVGVAAITVDNVRGERLAGIETGSRVMSSMVEVQATDNVGIG